MSQRIDVERLDRKDSAWRIYVRFVSFLLGLTLVGLGMLAIALPETFHELLRQLRTPGGMYAGAGVRVVLGASLIIAAPTSRFPATMRVFGWVFLLGGIFLPVLGFGFFRSAVDSFLSLDHSVARGWGGIALALGLFLSYSLDPWFRYSRQSSQTS